MQKRILFTDLDGTLLNDKKEVSPALFQTLQDLQQAGHVLVLSSGRPLASIQQVASMLKLQKEGLYISANNGGQIYNCNTEKTIIEKRLPLDDVSYIFSMAEKTHTYCQTYTATHIAVKEECAELDKYKEHIHMPYVCLPDIVYSLTESPYKVLAIALGEHAHADLEQFQAALYPWAETHIQTLFSHPQYLELFPASSGKGTALTDLCEYLHIPVANSMACGDMDNDISMIRAAGCGVAMYNATPLVKEAATVITAEDNNHDGLLPVIKDFFELQSMW